MNWLKKNICLVIIFVYNKLNDNYNTIKYQEFFSYLNILYIL